MRDDQNIQYSEGGPEILSKEDIKERWEALAELDREIHMKGYRYRNDSNNV